MSFVSSLPDGAVVIDDNNYAQFTQPIVGPNGESATGYLPRNFEAYPRGCGVASQPFPRDLLIPRSDWSDLIQQKEEAKSRLSDLCSASNVRWLNQNPSWYCWCYCVVQGMMAANVAANNPLRQLVPESVAGPIKNFRKQGGMPLQALEFIAQHGCADESAWPRENHSQSNRRSYWTDAAKENAKSNTILEWWELSTFDEKASCVLLNYPVPSGYLWMGHAMCSIDLVQLGHDHFGVMDMDSYARNGRYNTKVIDESRPCDEMFACRVTSPGIAA